MRGWAVRRRGGRLRGVCEPHGLAQRPGVGDFGAGAVSDAVADHEHLVSEPDLRSVQIVKSNLQRLGLDRIGRKFVRRLHVATGFDDDLSGFGLPQIGSVISVMKRVEPQITTIRGRLSCFFASASFSSGGERLRV